MFRCGTSEQNHNYILKIYDKCKLHSGCQYDFFELTKLCDKCDTTCERKIAAWGRGECPKEIVGPFEFANEYEGGIESNDMLLNENKILLEIFKANKDKISYCKSYETITRIYNDLQKDTKKKGIRMWKPLTFYFFGLGSSGKSGLFQALFEDELYLKPKKQKMNIFNNTPHRVEQKYKDFEQFLAKYIFMTARKPPNEAYNFGR
ncbi:hypothetical protein F8M41_018140 [Gigaspora margarita]|uniref:Uncharacterized protein n=1 Tax=Gigaspora margarita TaxID=4874 RepID=A0A8H4AM00_GIGMA|nr:hypothetical protein F8M41_018140 [Gigaspora margarita]